MNLAENLVRTAAEHPDRVAIRLGDLSLRYTDLAASSASVAGLLRSRGVGPGDAVGLMLPNLPQFPAVYYGILRAGAFVVPMNPLLKAREVAYHLTDSGARVLFAWSGSGSEPERGASQAGAELVTVDPATFPDLLAGGTPLPDVVERGADDTAVILYTSGTTGRPKGAELTHAGLHSNARTTEDTLLEATGEVSDSP